MQSDPALACDDAAVDTLASWVGGDLVRSQQTRCVLYVDRTCVSPTILPATTPGHVPMPPPFQPRRNSLRYPWHDYADPGVVFVTLCTHNRQRLFGSVIDGRMAHSSAGELAVHRWTEIPKRFPTVAIDAFVVMPDHIHGLIMTGVNPDASGPEAAVGAVIRWFKTSVIAGYRDGVANHGWPRYDAHLWQGEFYDRIMRNDAEIENRRRYIEGNPGRWWERWSGDS
jgi:putative transposase